MSSAEGGNRQVSIVLDFSATSTPELKKARDDAGRRQDAADRKKRPQDEASVISDWLESEEQADVEELTADIADLKRTDARLAERITGLALNPQRIQGEVQQQLTDQLTAAFPQLVKLLGPASIAAMVALAAPKIIKYVTSTSGWFDMRFRINFSKSISLYDRERQVLRETGKDILINAQHVAGYRRHDPSFVTNSLVDIDTTRTARVGIDDKAYRLRA